MLIITLFGKKLSFFRIYKQKKKEERLSVVGNLPVGGLFQDWLNVLNLVLKLNNIHISFIYCLRSYNKQPPICTDRATNSSYRNASHGMPLLHIHYYQSAMVVDSRVCSIHEYVVTVEAPSNKATRESQRERVQSTPPMIIVNIWNVRCFFCELQQFYNTSYERNARAHLFLIMLLFGG